MKCPRCSSKNIKPYANGFGIGYYCVDCNLRRRSRNEIKSMEERILILEKRLENKANQR